MLRPVQVVQWDAPWWLPRSINLLKLLPRPINKCVFYAGHKETLSPVIFWKIDGSNWNRVFSAWSSVFGIILQLGSGYVMSVSLVTHLNKHGFVENFLFSEFNYWGRRKTVLVFRLWWHGCRDYRDFSKQSPWRYWAKKLFSLTSWGTGKKLIVKEGCWLTFSNLLPNYL